MNEYFPYNSNASNCMPSKNDLREAYFNDEKLNNTNTDEDTKVDVHVKSLQLPPLPSIPCLDKITLTNFRIIGISDISKLVSLGLVTIAYGDHPYIHLPDGHFYSRLNIKDAALFDKLSQSISPEGSVSAYLELSIDDGYYHNLVGYTLNQYKDRLDSIQKYLYKTYGITIDFSAACIKYLEVQRTLKLDMLCNEYSRPLYLIMDSLPKRLRLNGLKDFYSTDGNSDDDKKYVHTLTRTSGKRGIEVTIYDKGAELDRKNYKTSNAESSDLLRMELKLNSAVTIKRQLGTNCIWELTDQNIVKYFNDFIINNLAKSYDKCAHKRKEELSKLAKKAQSQSYHWIKELLLEIANYEIDHKTPLMLDVKELLEALDNNGYSDAKQKYYIRKTVIETCKRHIPIFNQGDDQKCLDLITSLF